MQSHIFLADYSIYIRYDLATMAIPQHLETCFVTDVDGYVYFWPSGQGHFTAQQLRELASELDARNALWDDTVRQTLDELETHITDEQEGEHGT